MPELLETFAFAAAERRQTVPLIATAREGKDGGSKNLAKSRKLIHIGNITDDRPYVYKSNNHDNLPRLINE